MSIHVALFSQEHAKGIWPVDKKGNPLMSEVDYVETWKAMEECVNLGLVKSIGVSNFNYEQMNRVLAIAKIKPVVNQIECHVKLNQKKLRAFCREKEILTMAYSPLGAPGYNWRSDRTDSNHVGDVPAIQAIAEKYGKTSAQVTLKYLVRNVIFFYCVIFFTEINRMVFYRSIFEVEIGTIPIPKSTSTERIRENIDIFDFKLTPEEIASIDKLNCGYRVCEAAQ